MWETRRRDSSKKTLGSCADGSKDSRPWLIVRIWFVPCGTPMLKHGLRLVSGKVSRTSDHPIALGGSQDIYTGEWTGQEVRGEGKEPKISCWLNHIY